MAPTPLETIQDKIEKAAAVLAGLLEEEKQELDRLRGGAELSQPAKRLRVIYRAQIRLWEGFLTKGWLSRTDPIAAAKAELADIRKSATRDLFQVIDQANGQLELVSLNRQGMTANAAAKLAYLEENLKATFDETKRRLMPAVLADHLDQLGAKAPLQPQLLLVLAQTIRELGGYRRLATLDPMTSTEEHKVYNSRGFQLILQQEMAKINRQFEAYRRGKGPKPTYHFSIIRIDFNDFKKINDTYGHETADNLLTHVINLIAHNIRDTDIVSRTGGDEFTLIFPEMSCDVAEKKVQELQEVIEGTAYIDEDRQIPIAASISAGCSTQTYEKPIEKTLKEADAKMYANKAQTKMRRKMPQR